LDHGFILEEGFALPSSPQAYQTPLFTGCFCLDHGGFTLEEGFTPLRFAQRATRALCGLRASVVASNYQTPLRTGCFCLDHGFVHAAFFSTGFFRICLWFSLPALL